MAIIAILSGAHCGADDVAMAVRDRLSYHLLNSALISKASEKHSIDRDKLVRLTSPEAIAARHGSKDALKAVACLEETLAELCLEDDCVITGCPAFFIPSNIAHVLRVCLVADMSFRIEQAQEVGSLSEADAKEQLHESDRHASACAMELVSKPFYDSALYDITIPMHETTVEAAADLICKHASSDALKTTDWSRTLLNDWHLSTRVKVALTRAGHNVDVFSENGQVTVAINEQALMMGRLQAKLERLAREVDGVRGVQTKLGARYQSTSINPWENIDAQPKVLLVDDEREFVQTLSERLRNRNIESSIAYDGEQALGLIEEGEVPDVIVLDLMMPGIDGIETLRRVKQTHPEVEVIILTGHGSDREQDAAEDLGAFAYLRKPVNVNELAQVMKQAYGQRHKNS